MRAMVLSAMLTLASPASLVRNAVAGPVPSARLGIATHSSLQNGGAVEPSPNGVVKPGSVVDPGMVVIRPKMPPATMPVIVPRTTMPDGSVVVPR